VTDLFDTATNLARSITDRYTPTATTYVPPVTGGTAPAKSNGDRSPDPFLASRFFVEIKSDATAYFTECSGLSVETEVMEYAEGGRNDGVYKLPGRTKYSNITLRRGWAQDDQLWKWYDKTIQGKFDKRDISIVLYKYKGQNAGDEVARWNLRQAYPVKWQGPEFRADGNGTVIETLELAHDGWVRG
jgi:phage tail-like protein